MFAHWAYFHESFDFLNFSPFAFASAFFTTVTLRALARLPRLTVTVAVPTFLALTLPAESTVATLVSELSKVVAPSAFGGVTAALMA